MPMSSFFSTVNITYQQIADLLITAFEGGSNYWYLITKYIKPEQLWASSEPAGPFSMAQVHLAPTYFKASEYPLSPGGALIIVDKGDPKGMQYRLDLESIEKGLQTMATDYRKHFTDVVNQTDDTITADVFLQCCLFGKIIFG
jgi:hypothetical protein